LALSRSNTVKIKTENARGKIKKKKKKKTVVKKLILGFYK
jgi:hypothetical protein